MVLPIGPVEIAGNLQGILSEPAIDDGAKAITAQLGVHSVPPADPYFWDVFMRLGPNLFLA